MLSPTNIKVTWNCLETTEVHVRSKVVMFLGYSMFVGNKTSNLDCILRQNAFPREINLQWTAVFENPFFQITLHLTDQTTISSRASARDRRRAGEGNGSMWTDWRCVCCKRTNSLFGRPEKSEERPARVSCRKRLARSVANCGTSPGWPRRRAATGARYLSALLGRRKGAKTNRAANWRKRHKRRDRRRLESNEEAQGKR